jgi:anti-sigma-K factor RskA
MTERLTDAERQALLAGDDADRLEPDEAAELGFLADVLADPSTWAEPDVTLEDRVVGAIAGAAPATPAAGGGRRRRGTRTGRGVVVGALAAVASVLLVIGVVAATRSSTDPDFRAQLTATALAPDAHATVAVTHNTAGFRVALDAKGLAPLPDGAYYQAWLKNSRGGLVSVGTFSSSDGSIVLWSGVDPAEYRGMTVTVEPDDDNPASSGRRVLVGELQPR